MASSPTWLAKTRATLAAYWFTAMPARRLAAVRWLIGGFACWTLYSSQGIYNAVARSDAAFEPLGLAVWLDKPLPPDLYAWLLQATLISGLLWTIGMLQRINGPLFALLLVFVLSYRNSWGMNYHHLHLLTLQILALAPSAAGDALSFDAWLARKKPQWQRWLVSTQPVEVQTHARYGWPIRLLCTATACAYFVSGFAKLAGNAGWSWLTGENLRDQIAYNALVYELIGDGADASAWVLYGLSSWLFLPLASGSFFLEIGAPLALVHPRLGRWWAIATWLMHIGIRVTMAIRFPFQFTGFAFAPFFPLERPINWIEHKVRRLQARRRTK